MRVHLVEILLPLFDNHGQALPKTLYQRVQAELMERFGGLTAYSRVPAEGYWRRASEDTHADEIVVYEVMTEHLDVAWWTDYRRELEARFRQKAVVVRALETRLL